MELTELIVDGFEKKGWGLYLMDNTRTLGEVESYIERGRVHDLMRDHKYVPLPLVKNDSDPKEVTTAALTAKYPPCFIDLEHTGEGYRPRGVYQIDSLLLTQENDMHLMIDKAMASTHHMSQQSLIYDNPNILIPRLDIETAIAKNINRYKPNIETAH